MFKMAKSVLFLSKNAKWFFKTVPLAKKQYYLKFNRMVSSRLYSAQTESNSTTDKSVDNGLSDALNAITKGDQELEHKLKVLMLETEVLRQEGKTVPSDDYMTPEIWEHLLNLPSKSARAKYLTYLFKLSKTKENKLQKKLDRRKEYEMAMATKEPTISLPIEEHALRYGLSYNNIFLRIRDTTINQFYHRKLIEAIMFGQKLIIDCGYDKDMTSRENVNAAKQLMLLFACNRSSKDPFDIIHANVNKNSELFNSLYKHIPTMYDKDFPFNVQENSYLEMFPKEKLVYLTPHCHQEMTHFDNDAVYIIGALVDKVNNAPLSLAKAKKEGLRMQKFPLERYMQWGSGSGKSLTLNQCVSILLDVKNTGDWVYALRHVPRRKITDTAPSIVGRGSMTEWKPKFQSKRKIKNYTELVRY